MGTENPATICCTRCGDQVDSITTLGSTGSTRAALRGESAAAYAESERLAPLWSLFAEFGGGLRVVAAIAEHLGLARAVPGATDPGDQRPQRAQVAAVVERLGI